LTPTANSYVSCLKIASFPPVPFASQQGWLFLAITTDALSYLATKYSFIIFFFTYLGPSAVYIRLWEVFLGTSHTFFWKNTDGGTFFV
jgi:hypothetical protein